MVCCRRSDVQRLQEENTQLREELHYLQQLLAVWQPPACTCQLASSSNSSTSTSKTGRPGGGSTAAQDTSSSTHAAIDKIIRQQQVLIAQQQRQVQVLQVGRLLDLPPVHLCNAAQDGSCA